MKTKPWNSQNSQNNFEKNRAGRLTLLDFKIFYKAVILNTLVRHQKREKFPYIPLVLIH